MKMSITFEGLPIARDRFVVGSDEHETYATSSTEPFEITVVASDFATLLQQAEMFIGHAASVAGSPAEFPAAKAWRELLEQTAQELRDREEALDAQYDAIEALMGWRAHAVDALKIITEIQASMSGTPGRLPESVRDRIAILRKGWPES